MELSNRRLFEWCNAEVVESSNGGMVTLSNHRPDPRCFSDDFSLFEIECAMQIFACAVFAVIA